MTFVPIEGTTTGPTRPSVAEMDESGVYQLTPFRGTAGLVPGQYKIRVSYYDLKPGADPNVEGNWVEHQYEAEQLTVESGARSVDHTVTVMQP